MRYYVDFSEGRWEKDGFIQPGMYLFPNPKEFEQHSGYITNGYAPKTEGGTHEEYAYSSIACREPLSAGVRFFFTFSFEKTGCPSLVYARELEDLDGGCIYGTHVQACFYEDGVNLWRGESVRASREHQFSLIAFFPFPLERNKKYRAGVMTTASKIGVEIEGHTFWTDYEVFPTGYTGFIAWEGINNIYSFEVE